MTSARSSESAIGSLERGDHAPSLATLRRLADVFGKELIVDFVAANAAPTEGRRGDRGITRRGRRARRLLADCGSPAASPKARLTSRRGCGSRVVGLFGRFAIRARSEFVRASMRPRRRIASRTAGAEPFLIL